MTERSVLSGWKLPGLGIDHLWFIGALAGFTVLISLAPQPPNDFWWHLKTGEIVFSLGSVPQTDQFAWTLQAGTPYVHAAWLAGTLFYGLFLWGGIPLILFGRTLLALIAFGLVGLEAYRRSHSWRIAGIVTALACLMAANNLIVRPQNWSWIPFMLFLILLSAYADGQLRGRWLLLCPVIMIFWVNVHGAFILGLILMAIFFLGETTRHFLRWPGYRSWKDVIWMGGVALLTTLSLLVNPQRWNIIQYVYNLITDQPVQMLIAEWQPPNPSDLGSLFFFISLMILVVVWSYKTYRPSPSEILSLLAFLWLAWSGVRNIVWFGMVAMPILATGMKDLFEARSWVASPARNALNLALAIVFFIPGIVLQPWSIERLPIPSSYWSRVWRGTPAGPLLTVHTPLGAVEYLRQHPGGRLFNEMGYGSYLIWAIPEQGVFVDPRVELYPYQQWLDYIKISNGIGYQALLESYGVDRLLLDFEAQGELIELLQSDPVWQREYMDAYTQIWRKTSVRKGSADQVFQVDYVQSSMILAYP